MYGREREVEQLAYAEPSAVVLAGDPGVGKSLVLAAGQARADATGAVAPAPVTIKCSPAALQIALLDALGAAVSPLAHDEGLARTAVRHVADAARRMAKVRLDELASDAGKVLLGAVRARLRSEVAGAIEEFVRDLSTSVDGRLAARISAAGDGDMIEVIARFRHRGRGARRRPRRAAGPGQCRAAGRGRCPTPGRSVHLAPGPRGGPARVRYRRRVL